MSSSTDLMFCTTTAPPVQEDHGAASSSSSSLLFPLPAPPGYTAPPPTPMASLPPPPPPPPPLDSSTLAPCAVPPLHENQKSPTLASPPSKEDLDALAQFLMQQSLHFTPNLLASPTLVRKRRTSPTAAAAACQPDIEKEDPVVNSRHDIINIEGPVQTYSYAGGFCEESRRGIEKACQEVGAFYLAVQDAEDALVMLRGRHGADDESIFEGGLVPLSQLLTSASQHDQDDVFDLDFLGVDSGIASNTTLRDMITRFAKLLFRISKELLRFLVETLSIETQANIRGYSLKPLLHIHGNGKQDLNLDDDVVLLLSHDIDTRECDRSALFLARLGTQLQTWSQGKYKAPFLSSRCESDRGEVRIQFVLIRHY